MKRTTLPKPGAKKNSTPAPQEPAPESASSPFPIVGIGASAGGLEALEQFIAHVPNNSGMGIVIVQHLDPTHKGIMAELLQRSTPMKVVQVKDGTRVQPECVYIIPPNKNMSILHGVLHLLAPTAPRGLRLPIDFFFRSLAQDQQERSIGVILSGMGADGTLGLRDIKEKAGVVLVQEPTSAKFDGMPRSAIDAGLADIVAPAQELPGKIIAYLKHTPLLTPSKETLEEKAQSALSKAIILLRAQTGHDFSHYKQNTLYRRIERRMGLHQIDKMADYIRYLQTNPQELDLLFKELLIGVTNFFRDPAAWEQLRDHALPALLAKRTPGHALRAWVTGCSTGEEAYSLAMVFREAAQEWYPKAHFTLQIFATDLDRDAIDKARQGHFPEGIVGDMSPERLDRFFIKEETGYRVRKEIREMVIFAPQNLIMDPPFTKLDILTCRNLLIYLTPEVQKKLMPLFHYNLSPGGILFLGSAETVGSFTDLFSPVSGKSRLFNRIESALRSVPVEFPSSFSVPSPERQEPRTSVKPPPSLQSLADQLVLDRYAPPAALVNDKGDILYISGRTGKYLEPAAGKANWNIFAMTRDGLRHGLTEAFLKALQQKEPISRQNLRLGGETSEQLVDINVQKLEAAGPLQGLVMIVFIDVAPQPPAITRSRAGKSSQSSTRTLELESELVKAREETRTLREEMQTSEEELRSTNEEMQSTNEELQSTNEELTTSKEEMQSMNEELQTVNAELQAKLDELSRSNNDMKNLLNSTNIATLFLDNDLKVRSFTTQATKIINLIPGDVGRPITDLASELCYPELISDSQGVLRTLVSAEKPIHCSDGRWFTARIMPYRTIDNRIDGVVITFLDITIAKSLEAKMHENHASLEKRFDQQTSEMKKSKATKANSRPAAPSSPSSKKRPQ